MNATEATTLRALRVVLSDSIDTGRRAREARANPDNDRDLADFPLIAPVYDAAIPAAAKPDVRAAATRLRALAAGGDYIPAIRQLDEEARALVSVMPRGWTLPTPSSVDVEATVDKILSR
jgi:hypothetical protein